MTSERLAMEKKVLEKYFPRKFNFVDIDYSWGYLEVGLKTQSGTAYKLRIEAAADYPSSKPSVYVSYPASLTDYYGSLMISSSVSMHTLTAKNGMTQICHTWDANWNPNRSFFQVIMKARIWLEAYEGHKQTGKPIDHYLNEN